MPFDDHPDHTVLYVEDHAANVRLMERILWRTTDFSLITAPDAERGLHLARTHRPDIILMDINLPGMNGFEAFERLRTCEETRRIPVVALSANAMTDDIEKAAQAGFVDYLTKPFQVQELLALLKRCVGAPGRTGADG